MVLKKMSKLFFKIVPTSIKSRFFSFIRERIIDSVNLGYEHQKSNILEKHITDTKILLDREQLILKMPKNGTVAEVGVNKGVFAKKIVELNKPVTLHLIDLWPEQSFTSNDLDKLKKEIQNIDSSLFLKLHKENSVSALKKFENDYFDWIYIDTDHSYKTTMKELLAANNKIRNGGFIAGHDFSLGNWQSLIRYGVIEAVSDFCVKYDWKIKYLTLEKDGYNSFALQRL